MGLLHNNPIVYYNTKNTEILAKDNVAKSHIFRKHDKLIRFNLLYLSVFAKINNIELF